MLTYHEDSFMHRADVEHREVSTILGRDSEVLLCPKGKDIDRKKKKLQEQKINK